MGYVIFFLIVFFLILANPTGKEIQIASIQGLMFGFLYDCEEQEEEKYYTIQVLLSFISIAGFFDQSKNVFLSKLSWEIYISTGKFTILYLQNNIHPC